MWDEEDLPEAARDLTEAAWSRPLDEVGDLLRWLGTTPRRSRWTSHG
ncbi:hypothetical protein O1L60_29810 [Streptomyces diastatochromogenes]|nr:hypothetical protein [Streptomyces diastatochromogenes]